MAIKPKSRDVKYFAKQWHPNFLLTLICQSSCMASAAPLSPPPFLRPIVLDRLEQAIIVALWGLFAWRVVHSSNGLSWLPLMSESAVVVFVLIRRPTERISLDLGDWLLAITATAAPMLIMAGPDPFPALRSLGVTLWLLGNILQVAAKLTLRRSFGIAPANRGVKLGGPYRFVRHPMYAGYLWVHIATLIMMGSLFNVLVYAIGWAAQIRRLLAEERLLGQDPTYAEYMGRVKWRLIPGIF